jgi:hypothetical protein
MSIALGACASEPGPTPVATNAVASETDIPAATPAPPATTAPTPTTEPVATPSATPGTEPSETPPAIDPVGRSSMDLQVTYDVKAAVSVDSGALEVTTLLRIRNDSGGGIDHLELNTIAARLGGLRIIEATVDDEPVTVKVDDQTLNVPLGRILGVGESTEVRIGYRARLQSGFAGSDWMFTNAGGTVVLYRWIPWVSRAIPFNRPNDGQPFVTPSSPEVDVEIVTDLPMILAGPAADVVRAGVGNGGAWAFSMHNVRDVAVVLAPDFKVFEGKSSGVTIRVYAPASSPNGDRLLSLARQAVSGQTTLLGRDFPRPFLAVVETEGGEAVEAPGLIMVPRTKDSLNRTYLVHQKVAHAWFYDLVGNDQRSDPFADEAPADFLARTVLHSFRDSRCSSSPLDRGIGAYSANCYYEIVEVQGGLLLEDVRQRIGNAVFWDALRSYVSAHSRGFGSTFELLEAFRAAADVNLLPLFRSRFPSTY